jgi:hypothetical protein
MKKRVYGAPKRIPAQVAPDGACGVNVAWDRTHRGKWFIEEQHRCFDAVAAGVAHNDVETIERGLRVIEWGFRQQQSDGSFDCPDNYHSTSFFLEAAAHSVLFLQASPYADRYKDRLDALKPAIALTAHWMTLPSVAVKGDRFNEPFAHRCFLVAAAIGEAGVVVQDPALIKHSVQYIQRGIARQDPSGYNPEKNGYDTSYHAIGLRLALTYYELVADSQTRGPLLKMIEKGVNWLRSRIRPDSSIDSTGNTRTGDHPELGRVGTPKTLNYLDVFIVFAYYGQVIGDRSWEQFADKVAEAGWRYSRR